MKPLAIGAAVAVAVLACAHAGPLYFPAAHPQRLVSTGLDQTGLSAIGLRVTGGTRSADAN